MIHTLSAVTVASDLSDLEIIFDSTSFLNELNFPICGLSKLDFVGDMLL